MTQKKVKKKIVADDFHESQNYIETIRGVFEDIVVNIEEKINKEVIQEHSPLNAKGTLRYIQFVTNVRAKLCNDHGWKSDNAKGSALSISPDRDVALMIRSGNSYVGNPNVTEDLPKTNNRKISKRSRAIHNGQETITLSGNTQLLLLLHKTSKDGEIMHVEISRVSELDCESIISLTDRHCFSIDFNAKTVERNVQNSLVQEDFIVEDFSIKRK